MADLAVDVTRALERRNETGAPGRMTDRVLGSGPGWLVADVICTADARDRPFEERHAGFAIAVVTAGSFVYRADAGGELMTPGSVFLGSPGQSFECGHDHSAGDRCLSFQFDPDYFMRAVRDAGLRMGRRFPVRRLPPMRPLSPFAARAVAGLVAGEAPWEEVAVDLAAGVARLAVGADRVHAEAPPSALARVTRVVRDIERHADARLPLAALASASGLSPFHFLRVFEQVTGTTPHQYVRRLRLREAAVRLATTDDRVLDLALDCGFGDLSNFIRAFRAEFGASPRAYRRMATSAPSAASRP